MFAFLKYSFICEFTLISNTSKSNSVKRTIYRGFSQVTKSLGCAAKAEVALLLTTDKEMEREAKEKQGANSLRDEGSPVHLGATWAPPTVAKKSSAESKEEKNHTAVQMKDGNRNGAGQEDSTSGENTDLSWLPRTGTRS